MSNLTDALIAAKLMGAQGGGSGGGSGSGGGTLIIHFDDDTGVCDTTWQDIYDALASGKSVIYLYEEPGYNVTHTPIYAAVAEGQPGGGTKYSLFDTYDVGPATAVASCDSASGYPAANGR